MSKPVTRALYRHTRTRSRDRRKSLRSQKSFDITIRKKSNTKGRQELTLKIIMATVVQLPGEEFFSENYLDAFYRAHVATRTRGNLDEDIAAIEAEIKK